MNVIEIVKTLERKNNVKVIYLTRFGSKLYGTDTKDSDTDFKGIFVPRISDCLLKKDKEVISFSSGNDKSKNGSLDVDVQVYSIQFFGSLLKKGETGAFDLLFSVLNDENVIYADPDFKEFLKTHIQLGSFKTKRLHSFIGYCIGQSKKYGIKGKRYNELTEFIEYFKTAEDLNDSNLREYVRKFSYIDYVFAPGPKSNKKGENIEYLEVLGKKFALNLRKEYVLERLEEMVDSFGDRARLSAGGVDWKALSHAVRVLKEVEEFLESGKITFPLKEKEYIKSIKIGKEKFEKVLKYIEVHLEKVKGLLDKSDYPERINENVIEEMILSFIIKNN